MSRFLRLGGPILVGIVAAALAAFLIGELSIQVADMEATFATTSELLPLVGLFALLGIIAAAISVWSLAGISGGLTLTASLLLTYLFPDVVFRTLGRGEMSLRFLSGVTEPGTQILAGVWLGTGTIALVRRYFGRRAATRPPEPPPDGTGTQTSQTGPTTRESRSTTEGGSAPG